MVMRKTVDGLTAGVSDRV